MKNQFTEKEWLEDFKDFVSTKGAPVPEHLSRNILSTIQKALNPSPWLIFSKLLGIHSVVGTLSLAVCNQFGMNPFKTSFSLSDYFMRFGHSTCMVLCGILFVGLSVALSAYFLRPEELRVLKKSSVLQSLGLATISLILFSLLGAELALSFAILWLLGALIGGVLSSQAVFWIRMRPI